MMRHTLHSVCRLCTPSSLLYPSALLCEMKFSWSTAFCCHQSDPSCRTKASRGQPGPQERRGLGARAAAPV